MAFQSVPETAEIVITYTGQGSTMVNVLAAKFIGGYAQSNITALAANVDANIAAAWLPLQTLQVSYVSTVVRGLENENDFEALNDDGAGVGGDASLGSPGNVTLAIKKGSGLTGRSARGRIYWIGLTVANLKANKNQVDTAAITAIEAAIESVRVGIEALGWEAVIVSRFFGGVKRDPAKTFDWVTSEAVNEDVDSQRRRLL